MAIAAISAAVVFYWRFQDRRESLARQEAEIRDGVQAVWVKMDDATSELKHWGILVTNTLRSPVSDVHLRCHGNNLSDELHHRSIQPGEHFFESQRAGSPRPWAFPTTALEPFEFLSDSVTHTTGELSFTYAGTRYTK